METTTSLLTRDFLLEHTNELGVRGVARQDTLDADPLLETAGPSSPTKEGLGHSPSSDAILDLEVRSKHGARRHVSLPLGVHAASLAAGTRRATPTGQFSLR